MVRLAANLSMMFQDLPFLDRFDAAARAGFTGVEFMFPYDFAAADIKRRLVDNGLELALFNAAPGNTQANERDGVRSNGLSDMGLARGRRRPWA